MINAATVASTPGGHQPQHLRPAHRDLPEVDVDQPQLLAVKSSCRNNAVAAARSTGGSSWAASHRRPSCPNRSARSSSCSRAARSSATSCSRARSTAASRRSSTTNRRPGPPLPTSRTSRVTQPACRMIVAHSGSRAGGSRAAQAVAQRCEARWTITTEARTIPAIPGRPLTLTATPIIRSSADRPEVGLAGGVLLLEQRNRVEPVTGRRSAPVTEGGVDRGHPHPGFPFVGTEMCDPFADTDPPPVRDLDTGAALSGSAKLAAHSLDGFIQSA